MTTRQEWAFAELDHRRAEDARFPVEPHRWSDDWPAYAQMKRRRSLRRKAMGYSRATATELVAWAERMDAPARIAA
jgi:hypothetical protein